MLDQADRQTVILFLFLCRIRSQDNWCKKVKVIRLETKTKYILLAWNQNQINSADLKPTKLTRLQPQICPQIRN